MKKILILVVFMMLGILSNYNVCFAQKVEIDIEDLKAFRIMAVENVSLKKELAEKDKLIVGWQSSSANWQNLYNQEKNRADNVLEKAVKECDTSKEFLAKANIELHTQHENDKQRVSEVEFENRKLKSERKYYFGAGFGTGVLTGYSVGRKFSF